METIYYNSPVGVLRLRGSAGYIHEISFLSTAKRKEEIVPLVFNSSPECPGLKEALRQLNDYFSGRNLVFNLPLQQEGTAFQQKLWKELLAIKPGETLSYLQLSKKIGNVKAVRAVGTANGANRIAIVVPCHRVIGSNAALVGYSGDLWRKQWLLQHEAKFLNGVQMLF